MDPTANTGSASYDAALEYLYGRINYERLPSGPPRGLGLSLDRMRDLLDRLGNPQDALPIIHIAGTKGKGSTAAMIASVLTAAGHRTGLYTSPHLDHLTERIRIDGVDCSQQELVALLDAVRPAVASLDEAAQRHGQRGPTFFEITTALALFHFAARKVDAAVVEVGLGGRLDSTNVCRPQLTVITTISHDHTRQLGNTLAEIATEKAGIIKPNVPFVCGVTQAEPSAVIKQIAEDRGAPALFLGEHFSFEYHAPVAVDLLERAGGLIDFRSDFAEGQSELTGLRLGMLGRHQAINASVALAALLRLAVDGWEIPDVAIRQGLAEAECSARIEVVSRQPTVVLDTAHNVASIKALLAVLEESISARRRILIFAATRDKDVTGMLEHLLPSCESIILTQYIDNPRAVPPAELQRMIEPMLSSTNHFPDITVCDTPEAAWQRCQSIVTPEHLVCVTGSFFLAAEMRSLVAAARAVSLS
jgi:dihydrofolate synthase/folylpolyglutamate synthase